MARQIAAASDPKMGHATPTCCEIASAAGILVGHGKFATSAWLDAMKRGADITNAECRPVLNSVARARMRTGDTD